jgi:hypothetical protein
VTHRQAANARPRAGRDAARVPRAVAVTLLATPAMLLAHLVAAHSVPAPLVIALVAGTVFGLTAMLGLSSGSGGGGRWRLAVTVGVAQLAGHGLLALTHPAAGAASSGGCLPIVGRGAELGLRLALLRHDAACPQGSLVAGPTAAGALAALLSAGLVLAVHSLVAVLAAALVTAAEVAVQALRECAALVLRLPARAVAPVAAPRQLVASPASGRPVRARFTPRPERRRAPPIGVVATA